MAQAKYEKLLSEIVSLCKSEISDRDTDKKYRIKAVELCESFRFISYQDKQEHEKHINKDDAICEFATLIQNVILSSLDQKAMSRLTGDEK